MTTYFHCAPIPLQPGSIIHPGNWGRVIKLYEAMNGQVNVQALNEAVLELGRQLHAPSSPSRLECVFALLTLDEARRYRDANARTNLIYEVELVKEDAATHLGDYSMATAPHVGHYFDPLMARARDYWTAQNPKHPELLIGGPVRIIALHP